MDNPINMEKETRLMELIGDVQETIFIGFSDVSRRDLVRCMEWAVCYYKGAEMDPGKAL